MNLIKQNKKGVELTLNLVIMLIIGLIVLVLLIYFFGGNINSGAEQVNNISDSVLNPIGLPD